MRSRRSLGTDLVFTALEQALWARKDVRRPGPSLEPRRAVPVDPLHRASGGGRHCHLGRRPRHSYDNALAETVNGLFKGELVYRCGPLPTGRGSACHDASHSASGT